MKRVLSLSKVLLAFAFAVLLVTGLSVEVSAEQHTAATCTHSWVVSEVYYYASTTCSGYARFACSKCGEEESRFIPYIKSVETSRTQYTYTGSSISAKVVITDSYGDVIPKSYYTLKYSNNKNIGKATAKVTFKAPYSGTESITFKIVPKAPTISSLTSDASKYTLKWKQVSGVTGYQITASTSKKFDIKLTKAVTSRSTTSKTVTVPTGGIRYYVRIRSYKTVNGLKYYSGWSSYKYVTVKEKSWSSMTPAEQVVSLVNKERKNAGLTPVILDKQIQKAGNKRAQEISTYFSHTRPNGTSCFTVLDEFGIDYYTCGENIAAGYTDSKSVMNAWMNSPGHRSNILGSNYRRLGVGYYKTDGGYRYHWVQLFTN